MLSQQLFAGLYIGVLIRSTAVGRTESLEPWASAMPLPIEPRLSARVRLELF